MSTGKWRKQRKEKFVQTHVLVLKPVRMDRTYSERPASQEQKQERPS